MKITSIFTSAVACNQMIYKIIQHPIHQELYLGTFPIKAFIPFLEGDLNFLQDYSKAYQILSERLRKQNKEELSALFFDLSIISDYEKFIIETYLNKNYSDLPKTALQKSINSNHLNSIFFNKNPNKFFLKEISLAYNTSDPYQLNSVKLYLALKRYGQYLIRSAKSSSLGEAVASSTVCLWLYLKLGEENDLIAAEQYDPKNPYLPWLKTYQDPLFIETNNRLMKMLDHHFDPITCDIQKTKIIDARLKSLEMEYQIFDLLYDLGVQYQEVPQKIIGL